MKSVRKYQDENYATVSKTVMEKVVTKQLSLAGFHAYCWLRLTHATTLGDTYNFKEKDIAEKLLTDSLSISHSRAYSLIRELRNVGLIVIG